MSFWDYRVQNPTEDKFLPEKNPVRFMDYFCWDQKAFFCLLEATNGK